MGMDAVAALAACATASPPAMTEAIMNEDVFNGSIRKFLKTLGVSAQREIEKAVRRALAEGRLKGNEKFPAKATVTLGGIGFSHEIKGEIELE
jgi:hypothetical protein